MPKRPHAAHESAVGDPSTETTVEVRCTGHVRDAVRTGRLEFTFAGETLREFLDAFFDTYDVRELIMADGEEATRGWAPAPNPLPGRNWRKNPAGDQTRPYARVVVNGRFNEHLDGLETKLVDGDRVALMYPFMFCC